MISVALDWRAHTGCRAGPRTDRDLNRPENAMETGVGWEKDEEGDGDVRVQSPRVEPHTTKGLHVSAVQQEISLHGSRWGLRTPVLLRPRDSRQLVQ